MPLFEKNRRRPPVTFTGVAATECLSLERGYPCLLV